ncbi:MAG: NAD-dependent epimerase/dehydratase family protein [Bacteroidetes bacterium]|nr:NAD-dependent epimerase/dehydratase family protein [Bacteroidota bacterium]MCW5897246.1 NAD-dependent epimerase/dehydratase family protein [Bacteroidota bacterium]
MNILVTGGAGFIASHIVDEYITQGHNVSILDNLSTGRQININPAATFHRVDLRDTEAVRKIFQAGNFDVVNHHAAQMDVRRSVEDPVYDASVNIIGVLTMLECCVATGVKRVIFASSGGAIYGEQDYFPADELHPTRPISPYGVAKLTTEQYLFYYKAVYGINSVSLRYANIYGPRQNPEGEAGVVAIFTTKLLSGQQPVINGEGKQTRDYVFVGDVVQANVLALNCEGSHVFNIGTGIETDVNQLFHHLKKLTGSPAEERHGPAKKGEQLRSVLTSARIKMQLGWRATVSMEEGLRKTVEYFRSKEGYGA